MFHCRGGIVQLSCGSEGLWQRLAEGFDLDPAAPQFATNRDRVLHRDELTATLEAAFADIDTEALLARLDELGIPAGEVRSLDRVYEWDQTRSQGLVIGVDHPVLGPIDLPGPPLRFDDNLYAGGREANLAPPTLGQHDESVRAWLASGDGEG